MVEDLTFSSAIINDSIVSGSLAPADTTQPFSFLEFITNTRADYSPEQYNKFYLFYLKEWSQTKNENRLTSVFSYEALYIEFLKEITASFSTQQELRFLSKLDLNDKSDLEVAIPFFVEKIRQIILFYKERRDTSKFVIEKNKLKGSHYGVQRAIYEKIYDYVFTETDSPLYTTAGYTLSSVTKNLKIDIEEFVDVYGSYFELPKTDTGLFTVTNSVDIDPDLFFDDPQGIFTSNVFLKEIPLAVNTLLARASDVCDPTNPVALIENDCLNKTGFDEDQRNNLKIRLLSKYSGVDMYYINTTTTPSTSGLLFAADNPTGNIQNIREISTPTAPSGISKLLRDVGLFFKPDKEGIFRLNARNYTYSIDTAKLEANKIYIYPDPRIYSNVSFKDTTDYPLVFVYDNRNDIKNASSSFGVGDPKVDSREQTFSPYYSREQNTKSYIRDDLSLQLNFNDLFNKGYIIKYQTDIFGNEYALFKDELGQSFKAVELYETQPILNLLLNGHVFYDYEQGYNFDYFTEFRDGTTRNSGISSATITSLVSGSSWTYDGDPLYLYFRDFAPYVELNYKGGFNRSILSEKIYNGMFADAGGFTYPDDSPLIDSISASSDSYPSDDLYYYTTLAEGGLGDFTTLSRPTDSLTANFLYDVKFALSSVGTMDYNCGYYTDIVELGNDYNYGSNYRFYNTVSPDSTTIVTSISGNNIYKTLQERKDLLGVLYVKNQAFSTSMPISSVLAPTLNKYSADVRADLNKPKTFEIYYDTIVIEGSKYTVFDKILYDDGEFLAPNTNNTAIYKSDTALSEYSERFYNESSNTLYYCVMETIPELSSTNKRTIYPKIYEYNINNNSTNLLYPKSLTNSQLSAEFSLSDYYNNNFNVLITHCQKPIITYNSFNDVYKITYVAEDNNQLSHVFDIEFKKLEEEVTIYDKKYYKPGKTLLTTNFSENNTIYSIINNISGSYTTNSTTGILSI